MLFCRKPPTHYQTSPWTSRQWVDYFRKNAKRLLDLPWELGPDWTESEKKAVRCSMQDFQLGESSEGRTLLASTRRHAEKTGDPAYLEAMRLFIAEEGRHARTLGAFLDHAGVPLLQHTKLDMIFRMLRRLAGLELAIPVLVTAELVGKTYYRSLRLATGSRLLRRICDQLLRDEVMHVRFHCERLAWLRRGRPSWRTALGRLGLRVLFRGASLAVWIKHRRALRAGNLTFRDYWRRQGQELTVLLRKTRSESYDWSRLE